VIRILDKDGTDVVGYTYDPWGVPEVYGDSVLAAINPCSYRGYYYDEETGYYYLQSRYYDPEIGRFFSADAPGSIFLQIDKIVSANLFTYCLNNPISQADHTGFVVTPANVIGAIIGVIGGSIIGTAIANYFNLKAPWRGLVIASTSVLLTVIGWFSGPAVYAAVKPVVIKAIQLGSLYLNKIATWIQQALGIIRPFADKALKNVSSYVVKTKHLLGSPGNYNKFATDNMTMIRGWIRTALKYGTNFQVNSKDSYYVIYNIGRVIGTKGEQCIKVVFDIAGKIITAYPVK
jgi:RHS repeat-associated protein